MGLFDNNDEAAQARERELEDKEKEIADLKRELLAAKSSSRRDTKTRTVLKNEDDSSEDEDGSESRSVRSVSIKLPSFSESNPELWFCGGSGPILGELQEEAGRDQLGAERGQP